LTHPRHARRLFLTAALVGAALAAAATPAFAMSPAPEQAIGTAAPGGEGGSTGTAGPDGAAGPGGAGGSSDAKPTGPGPATKARGYDISYPQCGHAYPTNPAFAIVGVNGGRVFSANACLADQLRWGGDAAAEVYINTANPGPASSSFWPVGQSSPRVCSAADPDTADCAYDYGWNAAQHSYQTVESAYATRGITANPNATTWWLDVETSNSWRDDTALNVAALQGEVAYLRSRGVTTLGFYSTTVQWAEITGATKIFSPLPSWGAGAPSERAAKQHCISTPGFTGGRLAMVQYPFQGFDANVRC
jgi:hypothetical protein